MQNTPEQVIQKLSRVAGIPVERIRPTDRLDADLRIDPDDIDYNFLSKLERDFSIVISADDWGRVKTVQDVIDVVSKYANG